MYNSLFDHSSKTINKSNEDYLFWALSGLEWAPLFGTRMGFRSPHENAKSPLAAYCGPKNNNKRASLALYMYIQGRLEIFFSKKI